MRKEIIGDATLYLGDSMEIMRDILTGAADCIVTDPPYKLTSGGGTPKGKPTRGLADWHIENRPQPRMSGCFNSESYNNNGNLVECDIDWPDFMPLMYSCLRDGHAYVMANNRHIANCENAALAAGFRLHNWLVWDKVTATPNRWYMKNCEFTGFFYKGRAKYINNMSHKQLVRVAHKDESKHPTEKPVELMESYIRNSTQPGQVVLDPFMGSGSTGVAAIRAGRAFIGIEKDPRWFDVACGRIGATGRVTGLFESA